VPLEPANWELGVGTNQGTPDQVKYSSDEVRLTLIENRGPRISTLDKTSYGLYSVKIKACNQPGCITAFYVRPCPRASLQLLPPRLAEASRCCAHAGPTCCRGALLPLTAPSAPAQMTSDITNANHDQDEVRRLSNRQALHNAPAAHASNRHSRRAPADARCCARPPDRH
jgi:hypothetical protein